MRTPFAAKTMRDMLLSVAVIMVPIVIITWFFTRPAETPVTPVEWRGPLATARGAAGYQVLAPEHLPEGWTVTRVRWTPAGVPGVGGQPSPGNAWMLGALSPDEVFFSVEQTDAAGAQLVSDACRQGAADGTSDVLGQTWQRCASRDGRTRVLSRVEGKATTVLAADADYAALEGWAAQLS